jgi:hypothetical protein
MATKGEMTGMLGVYLVAAELSKQGFIVSPTSRSAAGADLLVTDQACKKAWSVQVKTNSVRANYWLVGASAKKISSESHMYVFVNNARGDKPEFLVAQSAHVAEKTLYEKAVKSSMGSEFWSFMERDRQTKGEGWEMFGNPRPDPEIPEMLQAEPQAEPLEDAPLDE